MFSRMPRPPRQSLHGRAVNGLLGGGGGVHGGHQAALDAPVVVQHLGDRRQAVGGAGSGGNDGLAGVGVVVHAVHEHRGVVLGRGGLHHLLGAGLDVGLAGFGGQEEAGAVDHDVGAHFVPLQVGGVALGGQADLLAVDDHVAAVDGDVAIEAAMHGVVLQHVGQVVGLEQVVDGDDLDVLEVLRDSAEHHAADAAKTVDTDFDCHCLSLLKVKLINLLNRRDAEDAERNAGSEHVYLCVLCVSAVEMLLQNPFDRLDHVLDREAECLNSAPAGADSPKRSMPTTAPSRPTYLYQPSVTPASTATRCARPWAARVSCRPRPGRRTRWWKASTPRGSSCPGVQHLLRPPSPARTSEPVAMMIASGLPAQSFST